MIDERPAIERALRDRPILKAWIIGQFDGATTGFHVYWDGREPITRRAAEHEYPYGFEVAKVRIRSTDSGLDQLTGLIFELHNMWAHETFEAVWGAALRGEIDKGEFTQRMLEQEFIALQRTREFLHTPLGAMSLLALQGHPVTAHVLAASDSVEEQLRKYRRLGYDMRSYFSVAYDAEIKPRIVGAP